MSQHASVHVVNMYVLTTCTFIFQQVCTIEPSFLNTTSGMHCRHFEGRHLVLPLNVCRHPFRVIFSWRIFTPYIKLVKFNQKHKFPNL